MRAYRENPTAARHAALVRLAAARPNDRDAALVLLTLGIMDQEQRQSADAINHLREARSRLPQLADYVAYYSAAAHFDLGNFSGAIAELDAVWNASPRSALIADAAMLAARAYKESGAPADAVRVLRANYADLAQPTGDLLLAASYRAANDLASAAVYFQRVYYQYPATPEAEQAASALADLKVLLGALCPPPTTQAMFQRAEKWTRAGEYRRARAEYEGLLPQVAGGDRELVRVRLGVLDFHSGRALAAYNYLNSLQVSSPEADAERLYYVVECARQMDRDDDMADAIQRLAQLHPQSPWRLKALVTAGNRYLLENRADRYEPLYRACYESFPTEAQADYCHWKVTWNAYLHRSGEALELLRAHLAGFPGSEHASAALYFLGRLAEDRQEAEDAKSYYTELVERFPNYYYAELADQRLADPEIFKAVASQSVREFLTSVVWPVRQYPEKFEPTPATRARAERARLLDTAGNEDLAERELRFGARADGQPHILAMQLAQVASKYGPPHRAIRLMKSLVPGYLAMPVESAPAAFWRLLFPLPWRSTLEQYARQHELDPYVVAALIRQESEFNPRAVSSAQAYGLTQILPSTGRALLRASRRRFRPSVLFQPELNLRLGTTYLRAVYEQNSARWERALASYNAGSTRVQNWLTWAKYREPAEFIETIPFSETRNYVSAVLRNAQMYRKLYSPDGPGLLAADGGLQPVEKKLAAPKKQTSGFKRSPVVPKKKATRPTRRRKRR